MAKTKSKKQEPEQKKSKFAARLIAVFMAVVVIVGAICAFGYGSKNEAGAWFKNGDVTTWFNSWGKGNKEPDDPAKPEESSFLVRAMYSEGDLATFAATPFLVDGNKIYLTILTEPDETDDTFTWTSSDTSCVLVEPNDDGRSAIVTCLQSFDEQILVKATSNETGIEAIATCDYIKRVQAITLSVTPNTIKFGTTSTVYDVVTNVTYSKGTIMPELSLTNGKLSIRPTSGASIIQANGYSDEENAEGQIYRAEISDYKFSGNSFTVSDVSSIMEFKLTDNNYSNHIEMYRAEAVQRLSNLIKNYFSNGMTTATVSIDYASIYGGKTYNSGALNTTVSLDISGLYKYSSQSDFNYPSVAF